MPRERTLKPVALATIDSSKLIVGERGDHGGVLPPPLRPALLGGGIPVGVLQAFHVADDARDEAEALDPADQVHLHARLVSVASGEDLAVLPPVDAQDGPDGRVYFGVHQDDGLPVGERLDDDARAELDRAGHVDDDVDLGRAAYEVRIFRDGGDASLDRLVEGRLGGNGLDVFAAGVSVDAERAFRPAVVDGRHPHAWNAVRDLVGEPLAHEPGADHADADRPALLFPGLQCCVDDDHRSLTPSSCVSLPPRPRREASRPSPSAR
jgi:hypothetical protein